MTSVVSVARGDNVADGGGGGVLTVTAVSKRYGSRTVLSEVSLTVARGEVVGLVGQNGAGKSTLLGIACGLSRPSSGHVVRPGVLALLPERVTFVDGLSGRANLELLGRLRARPSAERITSLLGEVGLDPQLRTAVGKYSQGMRQRLGIAQALMEEADLVVLDEPANGLDPDGMRWLRRVVRAEADRGAGVLVSSHLLDELEKTCDRVLLLAGGKLTREWSPGADEATTALAVEVGDPQLLRQLCSSWGWACDDGSEGQHLVTAGCPSGEVVRRLAAAGVDFVFLAPARRSLEDALLRADP